MKKQIPELSVIYYKRKDGIPLTEEECRIWEQYRKEYPMEEDFNEEDPKIIAHLKRQIVSWEDFSKKYITEKYMPTSIDFSWQQQKKYISGRHFQLKFYPLAVAASLLLAICAWWLFKPEWKMRRVPRGELATLVLSDGSKVWLNAASVFRYPVAFGKGERVVMLEEGEAMFEVAKNADQPFVVIHKNKKIQALGTQFNVRAYENEERVAITLLEGSVQVECNSQLLRLRPGEQAYIDKQGKFISTEANLDDVIAWKKNYFVFRNKRLSEIMAEVARWYAVEVIYLDPVSDIPFTGKFLYSKPIEDLLDNLEASGVVRFEMEGKKINIRRGKAL